MINKYTGEVRQKIMSRQQVFLCIFKNEIYNMNIRIEQVGGSLQGGVVLDDPKLFSIFGKR